METFDITLLTAPRYIHPKKGNVYVENILREDQLVMDALQAEGLKVTRVSWDDSNFDWSSTTYALFRAVWDYFERIGQFQQWYKKTSTLTTFINSKTLIDWNIDKHYLQDLSKKGVNVPNTVFVEPGETLNLLQGIGRAKEQGVNSDEFVLKPCVAGGARHTYRFHMSDWEEYDTIFQELIANEAMMLQEFQNNIVSEGEVSMMVMDGKFTHAVLKRAKQGDFRVQDDWGGTVEQYHPTPEEIEFAEHAMKSSPELPIYGRADIFKDNHGEIALAELEIFEPELWFRFYPEAAKILAKAIKNKLFS